MQWVLKLGSASPRRLVCRAKGDRFVSCSSTTMSTVAAPTRTTYQPIYTERQESVSSTWRLRGMPRACWSSQSWSGRSQRRLSRFTL